MNEILLDAFRHNSWATKQLIAACRGLSTEQLTIPAPGSFGNILETFNHIILSDAGYMRRLSSIPAWAANGDESADLDQLEARVEETARIWEHVLAGPIDAEQILILDEGAYETHTGVIIAQALHHGSAHREQICAMLTSFGLEPPDIQVWAYADATERGRERAANDEPPPSF
ncbi:MAG TPA: DinB family protein [Roseiflexaceae bacterium]|jgi:uncharacterized damage-inducible protein DinB|nr:DinB family protein [Roseiflexaceae bacterium]